MNTNSTRSSPFVAFTPFGGSSNSSSNSGANPSNALATRVNTTGGRAFEAYQPQTSLVAAAQHTQSSSSKDIVLSKEYDKQLAAVTRQFDEALITDRAIFKEAQQNLQKVSIDIFATLKEADAAIREYEQAARAILSKLLSNFSQLSGAFDPINGVSAAGINGLRGLTDLAKEQIELSATTCKQLQACRESACMQKTGVIGDLVTEAFKLRSKELELFNQRLASLGEHQNADLQRRLQVHQLKLQAEAQLFQQLTQLAELELKSEQQNFNQQKELIEVQHAIFKTQEEIRLKEKELADDKELALIHGEIQRELNLKQIDADTRCSLARVAAKEAVKIAQATADKEARIQESSDKKELGIYAARKDNEARSYAARREAEARKEEARQKAEADKHRASQEGIAKRHEASERTRADMHRANQDASVRINETNQKANVERHRIDNAGRPVCLIM